MAMQKLYGAVVTGEKYIDRNGEERTRFINVGAVFKRDDGSLCLKLEAIPVGFTGWVNFYEPREKEQPTPAAPPPRGYSSGRDSAQASARDYERRREVPRASADGFDDDSIPF